MKTKKIIKYILTLLITIIIIVLSYVAYVYLSYSRIEDNQQLDIQQNAQNKVLKTNTSYQATTYNIGYAAYPPDYTFFMDGGKKSKADSKESVIKMSKQITNDIKKINSDFNLLQEVDENATRSHYVDEFKLITSGLVNTSNVKAINYNSAFLMYPILDPIGKSTSGLLTSSKYQINDSIRYSLPIETNFNKFLDLDRAFSVSKIPVANNKYLMLYNVHLSAYIKDEVIQKQQINKLFKHMESEYNKGNYVVCGGDFNHDLLKSSVKFFKNSENADYSWLQPFPFNDLPKSLTLVKANENDKLAPTTRNLDKPYVKNKSFVALIDGFIVSKNVKIIKHEVNDLEFKHSDHNPVTIKFSLIDNK